MNGPDPDVGPAHPGQPDPATTTGAAASTASPPAEQQRADVRTAVLARAATALAEAGDVTAVAAALVDALCPLLADACEVALRGQDGAVWRIASGPGSKIDRVRTPVPDVDDHPLRRAVNGEFLVIDADDDPSQRLFGPADMRTSARALGLRRAVIAPLPAGSGIVGALVVAMRSDERRFSEEDLELVRVIARVTGRTIDNLVSADLQRRVAARLRTAHSVAAAFALAADAGDADGIAAVLVQAGTEEVGAQSGLVYLVERDAHGVERLRLAAAHGHAADRVERWRWVSLDSATPVADVVRTGASTWLEHVDAVVARYPVLRDVDGSAEWSLAAVPLVQGTDVVGAAFWTFDRDRRFDDADRGFLELVAEQCAAALGRARANESAARSLAQLVASEARQRTIAHTLQASLLPRELPEVPGFEVHVDYWPAVLDMEVGGDFYDLFPLDDGRWGIVLGDVCGKGAAAAAVTATARHSLRAAATHVRDEVAVVRWVHDAIVAQADAPYCTLAYAVLDLGGPGHDCGRAPEVRIVLAGHDQAVLVRAGGEVRDVGRFGTLLGVLEPQLVADRADLAAGDLLVLHTDGVTDAPGTEALERSELLALLVGARERPLAEIGRTLRAALDARRPSGDRDDTALLLLRRRHG